MTALRPQRGGEAVRVELDGVPWRTLPAAVVAEAGLRAGISLERERVRALARARRRRGALDAAASALARRDHSAAELDGFLERRGVAAAQRAGTLETLSRLGYLDDARLAAARAARLAERGYGDEAIRFDLGERRYGAAETEAALAALEPELERAGRLAPGEGARTARALTARGFSLETIESLLGVPDG